MKCARTEKCRAFLCPRGDGHFFVANLQTPVLQDRMAPVPSAAAAIVSELYFQ
jgi:hypothetical protein